MSTSIATSDLGAAAVSLAEQGFRVFPLRAANKRPAIKRWPQRATTDVTQVRIWWRYKPEANIGIATGDGLVVVDVDPRHDGEINPDWPETVMVSTPSGGFHLYYAADDGVHNSAGVMAPGVDVRGERGYVVAPPSTTPQGTYQWIHFDREIAAATPGMFERQRDARGERESSGPRGFVCRERVGEGGRNDYLASYAGWLLAIGADECELVESVRAENAEVCSPPLDVAEAEQIAESITRTHSARLARAKR